MTPEQEIDPQEDFERMMALLKPFATENPLVLEFLNHYPSARIFLHWNFYHRKEPNWEGILDTYRHRAKFSAIREDGPFVFGWEQLMPALEQTEYRFINITSVTTAIGTYIFFTNAERTAFIGLLRSNRALGYLEGHFERPVIYCHNGKLSSYGQWIVNGIWEPGATA
jgi:hypothetical protein